MPLIAKTFETSTTFHIKPSLSPQRSTKVFIQYRENLGLLIRETQKRNTTRQFSCSYANDQTCGNKFFNPVNFLCKGNKIKLVSDIIQLNPTTRNILLSLGSLKHGFHNELEKVRNLCKLSI